MLNDALNFEFSTKDLNRDGGQEWLQPPYVPEILPIFGCKIGPQNNFERKFGPGSLVVR